MKKIVSLNSIKLLQEKCFKYAEESLRMKYIMFLTNRDEITLKFGSARDETQTERWTDRQKLDFE